MALLVLAGLHCQSPPPRSGAADRDAYLTAMRELPGPGTCAGIVADDLRAECSAMGALALARRGEPSAALTECGALPTGAWQDECYFMVADGLALQGETARALCESVGEWRFQCLGHAINREATVVFNRLGAGREKELEEEVLAITTRYIGGREAGERTRRWIVSQIAARDLDQPFSAEICGQIDPEMCSAAYVERVKLVTRQINDGEDGSRSWRLACARTVSPTRAASLDLPAWEPAIDEVVQRAWQELCER